MSWILFLTEWFLRSSLLILTAALLLWLLRVKNPSIRLTAWTAVLAGSLAIPILSIALPKLPVTVWDAPAQPFTAVFESVSGKVERGIGVSAFPAPVSAPAQAQPAAVRTFDWARFAAMLYAVTAGALLARLFTGLIAGRRLVGRSRPTGIRAQCAEVRESGQVASPATMGLLRSTILLPVDWREWDPMKLDAVLAHESSHIHRRDPALQFLSAIHRALLWVSPLSWLLHDSMVRLAEEVSDNDAVDVTRDQVAYAGILLEFIQRGIGDVHWAGVSMARYDRPEKRVRRILNATALPRGVTRRGVAGILALAAPLAYLAAAAHPQARAAQDAAATVRLPQFEVASIKPVQPNVPHNVGIHVYPGGRVVLSTLPLKSLIIAAYGLSWFQLSGADEWMEKEEYDIEAKPSEAMQATIKNLRYTLFGIEDEHLRQMLQALLIDRFQLKFHRETRTGDVYVLERNGKPLALHPTEIPDGADPALEKRFGSIGYVDGKWSIFATSMPQLAKFAAGFILHAPVLDQTELGGIFDYRQRAPDVDPQYSGDQSASFRGYLQEAGFKLQRGKGPVETFVIDHAAKPAAN